MECIIYVIIDFNILTSYDNHTVLHLWTTATNENVKISDERNLLLEFKYVFYWAKTVIIVKLFF